MTVSLDRLSRPGCLRGSWNLTGPGGFDCPRVGARGATTAGKGTLGALTCLDSSERSDLADLTCQRPLIVSPCSAVKLPGPCSIEIRQVRDGSQKQVTKQWLRLLGEPFRTYPVTEVYRGRGFRTVARVAKSLGADIAVISAGLGYVRGGTPIPIYDLTLSRSGTGRLPARVVGDFDAQLWWQAILDGPFSSDPVTDMMERPAVYACLSRTYGPLIAPALFAYTERQSRGQLRIFGQSLTSVLPRALHRFIMPYDERLNAIGYSGARADFAHRALFHYLQEVAPRCGDSITAEFDAIQRSLKKGRFMPRPTNRRASDDQIKEMIRRLHKSAEMTRSRMLAHLRHNENVACEQARFSGLYDQVMQE